jgi:fido (protein-threonine AMPylation protein)
MAAKEWKPGCPIWEEGPDTPRATSQYKQVLARIINQDCNKLPSVRMVQEWHRDLFNGLAPHPDYLGNFRNLDKVPECLQDLHVHVAGVYGSPPDAVLDDVDQFISEFRDRTEHIDKIWGALKDVKTIFGVDQIVKLAAWSHGEWVRIHPFMNGNGRTSRLWVNYVLLRYDFPPIAIRPRPPSPYGVAAMASMRDGDHTLMESMMWQLLFEGYQVEIKAFLEKTQDSTS